MIPVSLKLSNFTSYGVNVPELDFSKLHLAAISGANGTGKSSLLDAITWSLWGWSRAGDLSDQLVHLGAKNMLVEFTFELDKDQFTVKRQRSLSHGGSTNLEFWSSSHNLTEGTIKATQQKIIDLLHLTYEAFINSSFLRQGHADEFTIKGPTDRKRILADILGLSHYDDLEEKAKEKVKEAESKLKLLEYQLLEIEAELSQKEEREKNLATSIQQIVQVEAAVKKLEEELKVLQKQKEVLILEQNLQEQQQELNQIVARGRERAERIKDLESKILDLEQVDQKLTELKKLQTETESLKKSQQEKLQLERQLADIKGNLNVKLTQIKNLELETENLKKELKTLSIPGAKCPTCGQEIGKDQKHQVKQELQMKLKGREESISKIYIKDEQLQIKKLEQKIMSLIVDDQKLVKLQKDLQNWEDLQKQKETLLQDKASLQTERKTRQELLALYSSKKSQVEKLEGQLKKLPHLSQDLSKIQADLDEKEKNLQILRGEEKEAQTILGQAKQLLSRSEQLAKLGKQKKDEQRSLQKDKEAYNELVLAFGKKGIQAMMIETVIPEIEEEANQLLDKLTNGRMSISFETQRETKTLRLRSGQANGEKVPGIIETLDIIISDEMGQRPYENFSGGEQYRVDLAIRLAISKLLTRRAGAKLQFLVIDEGFGTQDVEGRGRIVEVLDAIKDDFEKILIITHLEELRDEFPTRIEVSKNSGGSTFEVVGI